MHFKLSDEERAYRREYQKAWRARNRKRSREINRLSNQRCCAADPEAWKEKSRVRTARYLSKPGIRLLENKRKRAYYEKHREEHIAAAKKYYAANRERQCRLGREYKRRNYDPAVRRERYLANREAILEQQRNYHRTRRAI